MRRRDSLILLAGPVVAIRNLAGAQYASAVADWNKPIEPFRILGNLYYVGASDVSAFLLATSAGHILVDTGFRETVPLIRANMAKLGFRLDEIRLLLTSHAHYDHVGGAADIKRLTRARLLANPVEAPAFRRGGRGDFAFGDKYPFPPVEPDGQLQDGAPIQLGKTAIRPHFTPGHTKGCTSWTTRIEDASRTYNVVIAGSMSAPDYRLVDNAQYPEIVRDYQASFAKLRALPCDVFLSLHSWDFNLHEKLKARAQGAAMNPFVGQGECARFVDRTQAAFRKQYEEQLARKEG